MKEKNFQLKTGWKHWDTYLSKYVNKKVNILEIGCYQGEATSWFLNNLCKNVNSRVYAVDTWGGSAEYLNINLLHFANINFSQIEKDFDKKILETRREKQVIKMKMTSYEALLQLNDKKIKFDIIFIDASHEAKDVLTDAVLSWEILKNHGTLIFDDYEWGILNKTYYRPKIAIDSFINIFINNIEILHQGWQMILRKNTDISNKPKMDIYYYLQELFRSYQLPNEFIDLSKYVTNYKIKSKFSREIPKFKKGLGYNDDCKKNLKFYSHYKKDHEFFNNFVNYDLTRLLRYIEPDKMDRLVDLLTIKNKINKKNNSYKKSFSIYDFIGSNNEINAIEAIANIEKLKAYPKKEELSYLNFSYSNEYMNSKVKKFIKLKLEPVKKIQFFDIDLGRNKSNNEDTIIKTEFKNIYDILSVSKKIKKKIDIINIYLEGDSLFYSILFAFLSQEIGGTVIINCDNLLTEVSVQILWILKKYYNKLYIGNYDSDIMIHSTIKIIASDFKGIGDKELDELLDIAYKMTKYNPEFNKVDNNYHYLESIITVPSKYNKMRLGFITKIKKYNENRNKLIQKNQEIYKSIINYLEYDIDTKIKKNMIKKLISQKQSEVFYNWLSKHGILEYVM